MSPTDVSTSHSKFTTQVSPIETQLDDDDGGGFVMPILGRPFEELADYRKITATVMFLTTAKSSFLQCGSEPKGGCTGCAEKERHRL
jgi:hypothetical protein